MCLIFMSRVARTPAFCVVIPVFLATDNSLHARIKMEGDRGSGITHSLENHKVKGFLINTGPDSLQIYKASKPAFNVQAPSAHQRNAI